jgi:type II secretion system protein G
MQRERGFTLIELLIVVAIIGIIAAIAIPNLMAAMNRARQKRTMSDMRTIGLAWEARAVETGSYAAAGLSICCTEVLSIEDVTELLVPTFIPAVIRQDAWDNTLEYAVDSADRADMYSITSPGRDGLKEDAPEFGPTGHFDCDIIYSGGQFVQYPGGVQSQ